MDVDALVGSRFDYTVILCLGVSAFDLCKLVQCVQNSGARIVTNTTKYSHITPVKNTVHWLHFEYHSIFKTALLVSKIFCTFP